MCKISVVINVVACGDRYLGVQCFVKQCFGDGLLKQCSIPGCAGWRFDDVFAGWRDDVAFDINGFQVVDDPCIGKAC
ncbi:hypothetical protein D3C78_1409180 [compost metagenome]